MISQHNFVSKTLSLTTLSPLDLFICVTEQAPFWPAVMKSILQPRNLFRLLLSSPPTTIRGALASVSPYPLTHSLLLAFLVILSNINVLFPQCL